MPNLRCRRIDRRKDLRHDHHRSASRRNAAADGRRAPAHAWRACRPLALEAAWPRVAMVGVGLPRGRAVPLESTVSGYANVYYSAAALAGSQSWSAWFFGSLDASNFITVDKPPLAVMLMGLSVRIFGLSSWSILLPEALLGVASVLLLFVTVRRTFGPAAAVIAAVVMALTPAAVLMFRYNNPDALLTFLLIAGGVGAPAIPRDGAGPLAGPQRDLRRPGLQRQVPAGLPGAAGVRRRRGSIAAPGSLVRRVGALVPMAIAGFVASFWWVGIVELIPADQRPFIGGSTDGSPLQLLFGYDGLGRIFGQGGAGGGGPGGGGGFSGEPGTPAALQRATRRPGRLAHPAGARGPRGGPAPPRPRPAHRPPARGLPALGRLVPRHGGGLLASCRASSTAITPSCWHRRSASLVGAGVVDLWRARGAVRRRGLRPGRRDPRHGDVVGDPAEPDAGRCRARTSWW